ncbi:MAG: alpha/beta hydrolase-fold protein [Verrucomicrobia bacterium]|nr:alpha/beta hydrolase-fold protein [Verrucomicrobiota bacterium]
MSRIRFRIVPSVDRSSEGVFISGSSEALGCWDPSRALRLTWQPPFHTGEIEAPTGSHFEYKITRGSWEREAVDAHGNVPGNLSHEVWLDATLQHTVADWKDRFSGRLTREVMGSRLLAQDRELLIWLPPAYSRDSAHRFPLVILHDGDAIFDPALSQPSGIDLAADEWVSMLSRRGMMPESIVVGVRHPEGFSPEDITLRDYELSPELGGEGYAGFIAQELVAHMDQHYRTIASPSSRILGGVGLGALHAFHTALRHPGIFGGLACLSTSFEDISQSLPSNCAALRLLEETPTLPKNLRMHFDYGDQEIDECYEGYHTLLASQLRSKGLVEGREFQIQRIPGAGHTPISWRARLGNALSFASRS